jgi:hypothetical protein
MWVEQHQPGRQGPPFWIILRRNLQRRRAQVGCQQRRMEPPEEIFSHSELRAGET